MENTTITLADQMNRKAPKKRSLIYFEEKEVQLLDQLAESLGTSRNQVVRTAVKELLVKNLKKKITENDEYQAILNDYRVTK